MSNRSKRDIELFIVDILVSIVKINIQEYLKIKMSFNIVVFIGMQP